MKWWISALALLCVMGCEIRFHTGKLPVKAPATPLDLSMNTPGATVASWWRALDANESAANRRCQRWVGEMQASPESAALLSVTTGMAQDSLHQLGKRCTQELYSREIVEVKTDSETRAVVLATIKAATPIPAGVAIGDAELERRAKGKRYKYVLDRVDGKWKIAQIYMEEASMDSRADPWRPVFSQPKPFVHTLVYGPR